MFALAWAKRRVAVKLDNNPLAAEARLSLLDGLLASGILLALVRQHSTGGGQTPQRAFWWLS